MIELNTMRLIPEKQLANWLENLKAAPKKIYAESVQSYLKEADQLVKDINK